MKRDQFETRSIIFSNLRAFVTDIVVVKIKSQRSKNGELTKHRVIELFFVDVNLAVVKTVGHLFSHG